jgi:hypothetical protein
MEQSSLRDAPLEGSRDAVHRVLPPIIAIAVSGLLCWVWLLPGISAASAPKTTVNPNVSTLDQVTDNDVAAAFGTMQGSADFLGQFKARKDGCPSPLAWVSLVRCRWNCISISAHKIG